MRYSVNMNHCIPVTYIARCCSSIDMSGFKIYETREDIEEIEENFKDKRRRQGRK